MELYSTSRALCDELGVFVIGRTTRVPFNDKTYNLSFTVVGDALPTIDKVVFLEEHDELNCSVFHTCYASELRYSDAKGGTKVDMTFELPTSTASKELIIALGITTTTTLSFSGVCLTSGRAVEVDGRRAVNVGTIGHVGRGGKFTRAMAGIMANCASVTYPSFPDYQLSDNSTFRSTGMRHTGNRSKSKKQRSNNRKAKSKNKRK